MTGTIFHFDNDRTNFEDLGTANGATHWSEELVMKHLGYETKTSFRKALNRAKQACLSLNIACEEHFTIQPDGDHILTRFGCYLLAMNGDPRKPEVASAQAYFATLAETFQTHLETADAIDRVLICDEITDGQKTLSSTAKSHGVKNYAFFQNKGYMGMYNMGLQRLLEYKGIPGGKNLIDHMGKTELAAHLFRITQTSEKIKRGSIRGQSNLEDAAHEVGKKVRKTMQELGGVNPEDLPAAENIGQVKKKLKGANKQLKALDNKNKK